MNSFTGTVTSFTNLGIQTICSEVMTFRRQLVLRDEFKSQSGWGDALNRYMMEWLNRVADTVESVTYNPADIDVATRRDNAADTTRQLEDDVDVRSLNTDDVLLPNANPTPLRWKLDGTDPDIPQVDEKNCPNDFGRAFILGLDNFFVTSTQLDSRHQARHITKDESDMLRQLLADLFVICQRKGGESNRVHTPTGTLTSDLPSTFQGENLVN